MNRMISIAIELLEKQITEKIDLRDKIVKVIGLKTHSDEDLMALETKLDRVI